MLKMKLLLVIDICFSGLLKKNCTYIGIGIQTLLNAILKMTSSLIVQKTINNIIGKHLEIKKYIRVGGLMSLLRTGSNMILPRISLLKMLKFIFGTTQNNTMHIWTEKTLRLSAMTYKKTIGTAQINILSSVYFERYIRNTLEIVKNMMKT
jgi:hypothetical protein